MSCKTCKIQDIHILHYPESLLILYLREIFTNVYQGTLTRLVSAALFLLAIKLETTLNVH